MSWSAPKDRCSLRRRLPLVLQRQGWLTTNSDNSRVTGVRVQPTGQGGTEEAIDADLMVDATGRGSRTPVRLTELGYPEVEEERKKVGLTYVTQALLAHG